MADLLAGLKAARRQENMLAMSKEARGLLGAKPALGSAWGEVASLALEAGDDYGAREAALMLVEAVPGHLDSWLWLAACEARLGNMDAAQDIVRRQLAGSPRDAALQRRMGRLLLDAGRPVEAERHYREALSVDQSDALAWEGLSQAKTFAQGDDDIAAMEEWRLSYTEATGDERRAILSYALAKAYEDTGDHDVAARRVREAAAFYRGAVSFDIDRHTAGADQILESYDERFRNRNEEAGIIDSRPVFVIAPPAAGASWLARTLAAEHDVTMLDRDNALFWMASSPLGDQRPEDLLRALQGQAGENIFAEVGQTYLSYAEERAGRMRRIVDATSTGEIAAGAMGFSLPAAKFVQIRRDPRDLAWAILKRRFRRARHWTYHADDIARVLASHNRLVEHWAALFPQRFLVTSYEALAADPEDEVRRIAFFAGVDPQAAATAARAEAAIFERDPVGIHKRAGARFEPVEAALKRVGLV